MKRIIRTINTNTIEELNAQISNISAGVFPYLVLIYEAQGNYIPLSTFTDIIRIHLPQTIVKIIPQPLLSNKYDICLELHCYSELPDNIEYYESESLIGNLAYYGEAIYSCALSATNTNNKYNNCFEKLGTYLSNIGMSFKDVVRQWNYIPNIIGYNNDGIEEYALFNAARETAYSQAKMEFYPAATGIGVCGDEAIIIIYSQKNINTQAKAIENPLQISAYNYSEEVLNKTENSSTCPKPLFSRGMAIVSNNKLDNFFISGTASIQGEISIAHNSIDEQTRRTIENINYLTSQENILKNIELSNTTIISPAFLRVYIKNIKEQATAKELIIRSYPNTEIIILQADICRKNLLIEIEGLA